MIDRLPNFIFNIFLSGYTEQESDFSLSKNGSKNFG